VEGWVGIEPDEMVEARAGVVTDLKRSCDFWSYNSPMGIQAPLEDWRGVDVSQINS
jgi:hypothetical protein